MSFASEVFPDDRWAKAAAAFVAARLPASGPVVITGGEAAAEVYRYLHGDGSWLEVFYSDERCVPPTDPRSNHALAAPLLERLKPGHVHRIAGEASDPEAEARRYEGLLPARFELAVLGLGEDGHLAAIFPRSRTVGEDRRLVAAALRPDGLRAITLTPAALGRMGRVIVLARSVPRAAGRALEGSGPPAACPVKLLARNPDVTFLLDETSARGLQSAMRRAS